MTEKQAKAKVDSLSAKAGKQRMALETTRRDLTAAKEALKQAKGGGKPKAKAGDSEE